jgi:hypothetical protein
VLLLRYGLSSQILFGWASVSKGYTSNVKSDRAFSEFSSGLRLFLLMSILPSVE